MDSLGGVLCVDKPLGITSHDVVNRIRRLTGLRRVGHAGTLDPLATGVLLLALGRSTRLIEYLVGADKVYETAVRLGQNTTTYDAEGDVVAERPFAHLTLPQIKDALKSFRGTIQQQPPLYSAIKQGGQPLYKLARQGVKNVKRPYRTVTIHELSLISWEPPFLTLRIACSSGTYIRSLGHDLGEALGCGGHLTALRRLAVGDFGVETAVPLDQLTPENIVDHLLSPDTAVRHLPRVDLPETAAAAILQGKQIPRQTSTPDGEARTYGSDGQFLGIVIAEGTYWRARKMFPPILSLE
ncbi:tRNA pseudouridine(55) synthase [hydrothermal vent metagenome]|uniref:tRNA pseudouridine(55) synthase n=1 Tax=hydrothermal vent metagenome TaxID=652676 RepID=A0A3B0UZ38_9ZZZZ